MKRLLAILCLCVLVVHGADVVVNVGDFSGVLDPAGRSVQLIPTATPGPASAVKGTSSDDGLVTFTNLGPGFWSLSISGLPSANLKIPDTGASVSAFNLLTSAWTEPATSTPTPPFCPLVGYLLEVDRQTNYVADLNCESVTWSLTGDVNLQRAVNRAAPDKYKISHLTFSALARCHGRRAGAQPTASPLRRTEG